LADLPVVCQMTILENGATAYGTSPEVCAARLEAWGAEVIGFNCSVGPHGVLAAVEAASSLVRSPLAAQPNAGLPRDVHGRKIYMASPEYMAQYAQRLIRAGARFVGGCCGTTPEHIRRIADAVHAIAPGRVRVQVRGAAAPVAESQPAPLAE